MRSVFTRMPTYVITGASKGIGAAVAEHCLQQGAAGLLLNGQITRRCPVGTRGDVVGGRSSPGIDKYRFIVVNNMLRRD